MADSLHSFGKRAQAVENRHRKLADGFVTKLDRNGVIRHAPRTKIRFFRPSFIVYVVLGVFLAKAGLLYSMGEQKYQQHLDHLAAGSTVEQFGGMAMQVDPVTREVARVMSAFLPSSSLSANAAVVAPTEVPVAN